MALALQDEADANTDVPFPSYELWLVQENGNLRACIQHSVHRVS